MSEEEKNGGNLPEEPTGQIPAAPAAEQATEAMPVNEGAAASTEEMPAAPGGKTADGTAKMPTVEAGGLPAPAELKKRGPNRKAIFGGIAALAIVACIGCGIAIASQSPTPADEPAQEQAAATEQKSEAAKATVELGITAEGWTDESSPFIAHVYGKSSDGNAVDTYHAVTASGSKTMEISQGEYSIEWIPAINVDGSIYRTPDASELKADSPAAKAEQTFEAVPADQVTAEDINSIIDRATVAVEKGDSTLSGEAGKTAIDKVIANAAANPNANKEQVEAKAEVATATATAKAEGKDASAAKTEAQQKAPSSVTATTPTASTSGSSTAGSSGSSSGSSSSGSASSGGSSEPAHQHSWVAVTKTVHHDAVYETRYETVHHDAVYKEVQVCNACGEYNPSYNHLKNHALNDEPCGTYGKNVVVTAAYDEQVAKNVLVSAAYDETVTTGYKCSGCGATK